jgi:alpha-tubulin suppressor-like RCC1 family protein
VAVGYLHACGLKQGGALYCWGSNFSGALGDGTTTHRAAPGQVGTEVGWTTVAITGQTTFGVRAGRLYGWGRADERFLGATAESASSVPLLLGTGTDWTALAGAEAFVGIEASLCGLAGTRIDCWGANTFGQLGLGTTAAATEPSAVVGPFAAWRQVSVGDLHACGIATSGALACWGYNGSLALGRGGRWAPTPIVFAP